ncbi:MAG: EamA family transporter [Deltaproteobacteria bacterium]|nr:EamA family transporter [Deltaproteobacteria bacterium]MCB9489652.1 EamA family transporter [Deltaproteobacteria bacterium]
MGAIALAVTASLFWGIGTVLQKIGVSASFPKISVREILTNLPRVLWGLLTNWVWPLGIAMMFGGMICYATALGRADIMLVQPIVSLTGVVAAIIGVVFLREVVRPLEWTGIALILAGVVAVSAADGGASSKLPGHGVLVIFTIGTCVLAVSAALLGRVGVQQEVTLAITGGLMFGLANLMWKIIAMRAEAATGMPFSLGHGPTLAATFLDYPVYIVIATNLLGGVYFQSAFANGRASIVVPIVTILSNVLPILAAVSIFGEDAGALHALGILLVIGGTALLSLGGGEKLAPVAVPTPEPVPVPVEVEASEG